MLDRVAISSSGLRMLCVAALVWAAAQAAVIAPTRLSVSRELGVTDAVTACANNGVCAALLVVPACTQSLFCVDTIGWLVRENATAVVAPPGAMRSRTPGLQRRYLLRELRPARVLPRGGHF